MIVVGITNISLNLVLSRFIIEKSFALWVSVDISSPGSIYEYHIAQSQKGLVTSSFHDGLGKRVRHRLQMRTGLRRMRNSRLKSCLDLDLQVGDSTDLAYLPSVSYYLRRPILLHGESQKSNTVELREAPEVFRGPWGIW